MLSFRRLIDACENVYGSAHFAAGPDGRDGASIYESDSDVILAFRGTLTDGPAVIEDWVNDFRADFTTDSRFPGRVHSGFLASITGLWPAILPAVEHFSADARTLIITGHSKGGALAFLAGYLLSARRPLVVTFAAPRVGDGTFASAYTVPTLRFENPADVIPKVPVILYRSCGMLCEAPRSFVPPQDLRHNHSLETGYRPWVM